MPRSTAARPARPEVSLPRHTLLPGPVVIGGGIAGLCAALSLSEVGLQPTLLEADPFSLGGRVSAKPDVTFAHAGQEWRFSMEHGIHGWWTPYRNFIELLERYGLAGELIPAADQTLAYLQPNATHRIHVGRKTQRNRIPEPLHHLPLLWDPRFALRIRPGELTALPRVGARVLETLRLDPRSPAHLDHYDAMSAAEYARGLPEVFGHFMTCLTRSGFFADTDDVSLLAFVQSLQFYVFLRRQNQAFSFARGQIRRTLLDPLSAALQRQGGQTQLGVRVHEVRATPEGSWHIHWHRAEQSGQAEESGVYEAPSVVLALDMESAKQLSATSPEIAAAYGDLSRLRGRPSGVVRHFWRGRPEDTAPCGVLAGNGLTADAFFWLDQFQDEFAAWTRATGGSVSECHIYDLTLLQTATDQQLMDGVQADMTRAFPPLRGTAVHAHLIRNAATNSAFAPGTRTLFPKVRTPRANLSLCGDWIDSGSLSFFMERACHTGLLAANVLRAHHNRPERVTRAFAAPPAHVQVLQSVLRRFPPVLGMQAGR